MVQIIKPLIKNRVWIHARFFIKGLIQTNNSPRRLRAVDNHLLMASKQ